LITLPSLFEILRELALKKKGHPLILQAKLIPLGEDLEILQDLDCLEEEVATKFFNFVKLSHSEPSSNLFLSFPFPSVAITPPSEKNTSSSSTSEQRFSCSWKQILLSESISRDGWVSLVSFYELESEKSEKETRNKKPTKKTHQTKFLHGFLRDFHFSGETWFLFSQLSWWFWFLFGISFFQRLKSRTSLKTSHGVASG